jgi:hypothetical protein
MGHGQMVSVPNSLHLPLAFVAREPLALIARVPVNAGGIELSRLVVSVETTGKLRVCVKAWKVAESAKDAVKDELFFTPQEAGRSSGSLDAGFCKMEVTVAWSLVPYDK